MREEMKPSRILIAVLLLLALLAACVDSRRPRAIVEPTYSFVRDGTIADVQGQAAVDASSHDVQNHH